MNIKKKPIFNFTKSENDNGKRINLQKFIFFGDVFSYNNDEFPKQRKILNIDPMNLTYIIILVLYKTEVVEVDGFFQTSQKKNQQFNDAYISILVILNMN